MYESAVLGKGEPRVPGRFDRTSWALGPSMRSVISLSDPGLPARPTDDVLPLQGPPLQRATRLYYKPTDEVDGEDCLASHVRQLQLREAELKEDRRAQRHEHKHDMRELRDQFEASFEEIAARRAWTRQVATQQLQQAGERSTHNLAAYKDANTVAEFWPFEMPDPRKKPMPQKADYGQELLTQAERQRQKVMMQKMMANQASPTAAQRAAAMSKARARQNAGATQPITSLIDPGGSSFSAPPARAPRPEPPVPRVIAKRKAVLEAAKQRHVAMLESVQAQPQSYFSADLTPYEQAEAARNMHTHATKAHLRDVLSKQAAEKRMRDLQQHATIYGAAAQSGASISFSATHAASELSEAEQRHHRVRDRRRELEAQIQAKQLERKALKVGATQEQHALDVDAAEKEALLWHRDQHLKREKQAALNLALTRQEAEGRKK